MKRHKRLQHLLVALVLVLALFLRIRHLGTTRIGSDQAFTLNTAMRWVNGGRMPLAANKSSIGVMNPPMIEYLYAIALRLWPDILSVAILTMLSGVTAILAAGWATYRALDERIALWAMLIFAVNPWSVHYSQLIWNQTMVPVFSSLMLACLLLYFVVEQRPIFLILSFLWAACMTQVHLGSAVQLLTMGLIFVIFWRRLKVWPLIIGAAVFALSYVPFLLYETSVGWADVRAALEVTAQSTALSPAAVLVSLDLLHAQGLSKGIKHVATFDTLATGIFTVALGYVAYSVLRKLLHRQRDQKTDRRTKSAVILLLWLGIPILFYLRSSHYLQIYYLIGQLPAHFILLSMGLDGLHHQLAGLASSLQRPAARRGAKIAAWGLLYIPVLVLLGWQALFDLQVQNRRLHAARGPAQIRHLRAAIKTSKDLLDSHEHCALVALSEGHTVETSQLSILREFVSRDSVLLADGELAVPLPTPCALYLDTQQTSRASRWLRQWAEPIRDETIEVLNERWRFFELTEAARADELEETASPLATWENGAALINYERGQLQAGATLPLTMTWAIKEEVSDHVYHIGTYLLTPEDQVIAQSDGPGFDSVQWRRGDSFITWFEVAAPEDLPPGGYRIAVAMYTWPAVERIDLKSGKTMATLEHVTLD